jgi:hypothetical protein
VFLIHKETSCVKMAIMTIMIMMMIIIIIINKNVNVNHKHCLDKSEISSKILIHFHYFQ